MKRLIVLVPGLNGFANWDDLTGRLQEEEALRGTEWLRWDHRKRWYLPGRPEQLALDLRARIDQEWKARGPYDDIILVGHSSGALLIRRAYLLATGADYVTHQASPWAKKVSRIILFAGVNRGVDARRHPAIRALRWIARLFPPARRLFVWHLLRGSEFVTNLRVEWIRHFATLGDAAPVVVQLLGTRDQLVARDDSVDVEQFRNAYYIQIPEATHANLFQLKLKSISDPEGRYALLRDAFVNPFPIKAQNIDIHGPERIVFVLHGIRANNKTWVDQIVKTIKQRWPEVQAIGPGYGYVSALRFAIPMIRRRHLEWFQDAYSEALARNPRARFSFIGHSNGTYLFGESLRQIPGMRFEHAVLVGSVLPADYNWGQRLNRQQLQSIRVDGSRDDWPVGWLCSALRGLRMRDVGTGGFDGFTGFVSESKNEFFWYNGGHSAPLEPQNLPALAEYAVDGTIVAPTNLAAPRWWFAACSRALRLVSPIAAFVAAVSFLYLISANPLLAIELVFALLIVVFVLDIT